MIITVAQMRAARALLGMNQSELAVAAGVAFPTVQRMERGGISTSKHETVMRVVEALQEAGVEFIPENGGGPGVRLKESTLS